MNILFFGIKDTEFLFIKKVYLLGLKRRKTLISF